MWIDHPPVGRVRHRELSLFVTGGVREANAPAQRSTDGENSRCRTRSATRTMRPMPALAASSLRHPPSVAHGLAVGVERGIWVAVVGTSYERRGVVDLGVVVAITLVAATVVAPIVDAEVERASAGRGELRMRAGAAARMHVAQALVALTVAAVIATGAEPVLFAMAVALAASAATFTRPVHRALLDLSPSRAPHPELCPVQVADDQRRAKFGAGGAAAVGGLVGPAAAGVLTVAAGPGAAIVAGAGALVAAAVLALAAGAPRPRRTVWHRGDVQGDASRSGDRRGLQPARTRGARCRRAHHGDAHLAA